jgi:hypothetical protein
MVAAKSLVRVGFVYELMGSHPSEALKHYQEALSRSIGGLFVQFGRIPKH